MLAVGWSRDRKPPAEYLLNRSTERTGTRQRMKRMKRKRDKEMRDEEEMDAWIGC